MHHWYTSFQVQCRHH